MSTITLPTPDVIRARIVARKAELRALSRLLRMSQAATVAADASDEADRHPIPPDMLAAAESEGEHDD